MFTRQAPPILQAMYTSGMSPASAAAMENLLGQCRQPLRHGGPVQIDYTRPDMRLITPLAGDVLFPGAQLPVPQDMPPNPDPEDGLPDRRVRPQGLLPPEHLPDEPPQPAGPGEVPALNRVPSLDYFPGKYVYLNRDFRQFGLRSFDSRRHTVFPTNLNQAGTINSVSFKASSRSPFVGLKIDERPRSTDFSVGLTGLSQVEFLSSVDLSDPSRIRFKTTKAWVFGPQEQPGKYYDIVACCDPCIACYKIDYEWKFDCDGPTTYSGSILFRQGEIECYSDGAATIETNGAHMNRVNYGDACSPTPGIDLYLEFRCDGLIIANLGSLAVDTMDLGVDLCCGEATGEFAVDFPDNAHSLKVTISVAGAGACDCTGYIPVGA